MQELLGHRSLATTQIYTHVTTDRLKDAYQKAHTRERNSQHSLLRFTQPRNVCATATVNLRQLNGQREPATATAQLTAHQRQRDSDSAMDSAKARIYS